MPRVTVLIAVRDGLPWIRVAVESVLAQTYGDFELLLVDDASSDCTGDAARAYGDDRIRVVRNERNLGQAPSLNRGLEEARGDLVARLDADDEMLPERLARQVELFEAQPRVALVGTWMDVVDERGKLWGEVRGRVRDFAEFVAAILTDQYPWGHPSLMFRRDVVRSLGGYDASLAPSEDKDLYRRLALARHEARGVEWPLVRYRRHDAQLSQQYAERQLRTDHEGQERFLAELVGREPAAAYRVLLADGVAPGLDPAPALAALLAGAATRLQLSPHELANVEMRLATHLGVRALASGPPGASMLAWAAERHPQLQLMRPLLPLVPPARAAARAVRRLAKSKVLERVRRQARKSRRLRGVYARLR